MRWHPGVTDETRIAVFTTSIPWGKSEQFIYAEIDELERLGYRVLIVPVRPQLGTSHHDGHRYRNQALGLPLLHLGYAADVGYWLWKRPWRLIKLLVTVAGKSGSFRKMLKNLVVMPKGLSVARAIQPCDIQHIHAHWLSTPSTMAMIVSELLDLPWSVTAHRWDIAERNMLKPKIESAVKVRTISRDGERELKAHLSDERLRGKVVTIHMGITVPPDDVLLPKEPLRTPVIVVPGRLVEKKGHFVLLEALALLKRRHGIAYRCQIAGDGHLRGAIAAEIERLGLGDSVELVGQIAHQSLLDRYHRGEVDLVVLPSIVIDDGEREGIPVSIMEAMGAGVAVITTRTGGTAELVEGAGVLIPQRNVEALEQALFDMLTDPSERERLARLGRDRVRSFFSANTAMRGLADYWRGAG